MTEVDQTKSESLPVRPAKEPTEKESSKDTVEEARDKTDSAPSSTSKNEMAGSSPEKRSRPSYSEAVSGFEDTDKPPAPPPRTKSKGRESSEKGFDGSNDKGNDTHMLMDLDHETAANLDASSMEMFDAVSYQTAPPPKGNLPPTAEEEEPDEELPAGYEKTSFTARQARGGADAKLQEEVQLLRRHVNDISRKYTNLVTEKQIAEETAERATERLNEIKSAMDYGMTDIERDTESLANDLKKAKEENQALREQLKDAQAHIFSLQPYRKDLTPEEMGREYDALVESIQDWVQKFMDPLLEDHDQGVEAILTATRKRSAEAAKFKRAIQQYPDLVHAAQFPETDEDIITSIIMRYLHDNIFQSILYSDIPKYTEVVSFIENHMQMSVEPKRDLFSVRTWTAEAYNALLSSPPFRSVRDRRRKDMTIELCSMLRIFCKKDKLSWFYDNMDNNCVWPAMQLYEKLQVSTHHFYLDINPYIMWSSGGGLNASPEFMDSLKTLDCSNILQNRKAFNVNKIDPPPTKKELYHRLLNVCTVVPALYMRQIGQRDAIKEPIIVRKQQMLVAWGSEDKRRAFIEKGDAPLISHMIYSKNDRSGESWTASFRWS